MNNLIRDYIYKYKFNSVDDVDNAIREVMQQITLLALHKSRFFDEAMFCGGTALRLFYNLNRMSEDLDFSCIGPKSDFSLVEYFEPIKKEFARFGLEVEVVSKNDDDTVKSAFVKDNSLLRLMYPELSEDVKKHVDPRRTIRVKFEIDTNSPSGAEYEYKHGLYPFPYRVCIMKPSSLYAGKLHAILCRSWTKGRDFFDYVFYLQNHIEPNYLLLKNSLKQTGYDYGELNSAKVKSLLIERFKTVDYEAAKSDCSTFIDDYDAIEWWNQEAFTSITEQYFK